MICRMLGAYDEKSQVGEEGWGWSQALVVKCKRNLTTPSLYKVSSP